MQVMIKQEKRIFILLYMNLEIKINVLNKIFFFDLC
jgi:hypothetical protein